nr:acyloxyacyl hydrolase [uncultured Glaciecola sp.]
MNKIVFCPTLLYLFFLYFPQCTATAGELSLSWGEGASRYSFKVGGEKTPDAIRLAYIHPTDWEWEFAADHKLRLEFEFGVHHWKDSFLNKAKNGVVFNPMWRYYIPSLNQELYLGVGIGLAYTSSDRWLDRQLGARLLFEDKFEVGIKLLERHRLSFSINHYSNAQLADINHGANIYYFNYAYQL